MKQTNEEAGEVVHSNFFVNTAFPKCDWNLMNSVVFAEVVEDFNWALDQV
jgi:hypothetical protein